MMGRGCLTLAHNKTLETNQPTERDMDKITTDNQLDAYCLDLAKSIVEETKDQERRRDLAHEFADQSEHVIYYGNAHSICQHCDISNGEDFFDECYDHGPVKSYDEIATIMAYGEMQSRILSALDKIEEEADDDLEEEADND